MRGHGLLRDDAEETEQDEAGAALHADPRAVADRAFIKRFYDALNNWEWEDEGDFWRKYGQGPNEEAFITVIEVAWYFEGVGQLLRDGLIDIGLVYAMYSDRVIRLWEKFLPVVEGLKETYGNPDYYGNFEYLYDELRKKHLES